MLTAATASGSQMFSIVFLVLINLALVGFYGGMIYLFLLLIKALRKYLGISHVRREDAAVCRSLGEALKAHRLQCQMTQEFVAEHLGVSRQAVSKWETGASDPSTSNLLSLSRLYGIDAAQLLREIQH